MPVQCSTGRPYLNVAMTSTIQTSLKRYSRVEAVNASACKICSDARDP